MIPSETVLMLIYRRVTHTRSYLYHARIHPRKSLSVHVALPLFRIYQTTLVQTVSHPSRRAAKDVRRKDRVGIPVRGHAMRGHARLVMRR
jgi:hypothetical protein